MRVNLCQPGGGVSCGACCGLYNFRDHSRAAVTSVLRRQTAAFEGVPRTREAFRAAARGVRASDSARAFPEVLVCPLLGFIDAEARQVGCLGHPAVTGGVDLRDCGAYTAEVCEGFECPSYLWLSADEARLIREACGGDFYLYGLAITDVDLLRGCLWLLSNGAGRRVDAPALLACPPAIRELERLYRLKGMTALDPAAERVRFGAFDSDPGGQPRPRTIAYEALGARAAPEDGVLLCLEVDPRTRDELEAARLVVRAHVASILDALTANERSASRNAPP